MNFIIVPFPTSYFAVPPQAAVPARPSSLQLISLPTSDILIASSTDWVRSSSYGFSELMHSQTHFYRAHLLFVFSTLSPPSPHLTQTRTQFPMPSSSLSASISAPSTNHFSYCLPLCSLYQPRNGKRRTITSPQLSLCYMQSQQ